MRGRLVGVAVVVALGWTIASSAVAASAPRVDASGPSRKPSQATQAALPAPVADLPPLDLSPSVVKAAIVAADLGYAPPTARGTPFGRTPSPQAKTDRAFKAAELGRCGGPDTLKFESLPVWGDFTIGGLFAIPYAIHAMATGRCKF